MNVYLVNESSVLTDFEAGSLAIALNYQSYYQFGRAGWRSDVRCYYARGGGSAVIPVGGYILHLLDTSDQQGALGYHDERGKEVPYARAFCKTAQEDGQHPSEVASHELLEMAVDPHINDSCLDGKATRLYAKEACDACQGNGYTIHPTGAGPTVVADFLLPSYFDPNTPAHESTDYRGALKGPFALGGQGYYSYLDLHNLSAGWQQQVGAERKGPGTPDRDDRLGRRVRHG